MNIKNKIKTTGERSIEPKLGKKRLIYLMQDLSACNLYQVQRKQIDFGIQYIKSN
ncbi:MAG: hypothetical protein Ct9H300mP5_2880 [Candidatus Pelagibacterales bacterium]|nr:MAG: hypothetical protein Ct9H300mP5_2880 [Pelagibacterales bacterium]